MSSRLADWRNRFQVPKDEDSYYENTRWCNRDLIPMPADRRTFGVWSYAGYWTVTGSNISAWSIGSTMLALGLSPQEAIGVVIVGSTITGLLAVACGWVGEKHHIGYTVSSRFSWGMYGSYFPVLLRIFVGCIWLGLQAFWGGQSMRVLIGAVIPGFAHMKNFFSAGSHLATNDFIGLIIWMLGFVGLVLVRPERLQIPFFVSFILVSGSWIGLLAWAISDAGGSGALFHQPSTAPDVGQAFIYGVTAVLGAWGGGTLGQSDWTRYSKHRGAPLLSQMIVAPVTISVTAIIGIVVTSAAKDVLGGELIWNPINLLAAIQEHYQSSPRARAGVFFAALGLNSSQLLLAVVLNSMSAGMDMAGLWPKYINIHRGSSIAMIIGIACQPWQLLYTASKFLRVLSSFGIFLAPAVGILLTDYHIVRQRRLKVDELYVGTSSSIYYFDYGVNWRAVVSFIAGMWPLLPGLVASVENSTNPFLTGWIRLYNLTFIVGCAISAVLFWILNRIWPAPGLMEESVFVGEVADNNEPHRCDEEAVAKEESSDAKERTLVQTTQ